MVTCQDDDCGFPNLPNTEFCARCGKRLVDEPADTQDDNSAGDIRIRDVIVLVLVFYGIAAVLRALLSLITAAAS